MKHILKAITFCLLTIVANPLFATNMDDINFLQDQALRGDSEAQAVLGDIYARGESRPRDWTMAKRWYEEAANGGNTYAQYMLGLIYQLGLTGPADAAQANYWYMSADQHKNSPRAKRMVGQFFADYDNAQYNPEQAFRWYESAALAGDVEAQDNMGDIYLEGKWVEEDVLSAVKWYGKAAAQRSPYAQYSLGQMFYTGYPTFPQDYAQSLGWFYQAAVQCFVAAQYMMGDLYYTGEGVKQSNVQAYAWWTLVKALSDYPAAQVALDKVVPKMSAEELQLANQLAKEYLDEYGSYCNLNVNPYLNEYLSRHNTKGVRPTNEWLYRDK
jgi:TPR repeat protein